MNYMRFENCIYNRNRKINLVERVLLMLRPTKRWVTGEKTLVYKMLMGKVYILEENK